MLWTHGAGSGRDHHTLVALEAALAPCPAVRLDFPYRAAGRKFPDRAPVLLEALRGAACELVDGTGCAPDRLLLGGRSMGGRMCTMAVAAGLPAVGVVAISYPLHPPGKPEQLRTDHFPQLTVPCLFVSGTSDSFGAPGELEAATLAIPGPVTHHWIDKGRHDLDRCDDEIVATVQAWVSGLG